MGYVEKVRSQVLSLRHYNVLLNIQSFETTAKTTSSATTNVAANAAMLLLVIAQTVAFDVGSEDGFP
jgi:hypothetical protein